MIYTIHPDSLIKKKNNMDSSAEIFCPICKLKNDASAIFCVHCQSPLSTHQVSKQTVALNGKNTKIFEAQDLQKDIGIPKKGIAIRHQESGQQICIEEANHFLLGRKTDEQPEQIVDLNPYGAYGMGVSRHHAAIQKTPSGYTLADLGSTNGTWLDDEQLTPNKPTILTSGAHIRLGKMQLSVLFSTKKK